VKADQIVVIYNASELFEPVHSAFVT